MALVRCFRALRSLSESLPHSSRLRPLPRPARPAHRLLAALLLSASALASSQSPFSGTHSAATATACDSDLLAAMSAEPSTPSDAKQSPDPVPDAAPGPADSAPAPSAPAKLPSVFLNHGGGPSFFMSAEPGDFMYGLHDKSKYGEYLRAFAKKELGDARPKAIVVFSAHWETSGAVYINTRDKHTLYYDYGGFPAYTYQLKYPVKGDPQLGRRIAALLQSAGFKTKEDRERGLDHGVFIPLKVMFPEADVPVVQVSLLDSLDPAAHIRIGAALEPLRSEGVLIFGSGALTHGFGAKPAQAQAFAKWGRQAACSKDLTAEQRFAQFENVHKAPSFRHAHPSSEHLVPLFVAAGAGGLTAGKPVYQEAVAEGLFDLTGFRFD